MFPNQSDFLSSVEQEKRYLEVEIAILHAMKVNGQQKGHKNSPHKLCTVIKRAIHTKADNYNFN